MTTPPNREKQDFKNQIYSEVKKLFPDGDVEALVRRASFSGGELAPADPAVRLVHRPSGAEVTCAEYPSQTENYIVAAIRLRVACDQKDG